MTETPHLRRDVDDLLHRMSDDLAVTFAGVFGPETVDRYLHESYAELARNAAITRYAPLIAERFARERLTALAQTHGTLPKPVLEVLLVCEHNAGRSQMAAALLERAAAGRVHVRSAGSLPALEINPAVIAAMDEIGLDLAKEYPKPLTDEIVRAADVVITMGCGDACPVYPGRRYLDWELPDPYGQPLPVVRAIRDAISSHVDALLADVLRS